jgi:hypothetical protein
MTRCHVRCRKCDARRVLRAHPDLLAVRQIPKCACGVKDWRADKWMNRRNTSPYGGGMGCNCGGYVALTNTVGWPHRQGSPYCYFRKDGTQRMPGDADFKDALLERYAHENKETNNEFV